jgi:hypothetical protein
MCADPDLPTPRRMLQAHYVRVLLTCTILSGSADVDLQKLVNTGQCDMPPINLHKKCSHCSNHRGDTLDASKYNPPPWQVSEGIPW